MFLIFLKKCCCHLLTRRTSVGPTRPKKRAGRDENTFSLCHRFHSLFTSFILITAISQAPSPQPKKEKGRRKCGLKPKKREGKGDEFLLQNGKQVQRGNWGKCLFPVSGQSEDTGCYCGDRGAVQDQGKQIEIDDRNQILLQPRWRSGSRSRRS